MEVDVKNYDLLDLMLEMCFANEYGGVDGGSVSRLTVGSGYGYVVDETEPARRIFSTVVTRRAHNTERPLRVGWS